MQVLYTNYRKLRCKFLLITQYFPGCNLKRYQHFSLDARQRWLFSRSTFCPQHF